MTRSKSCVKMELKPCPFCGGEAKLFNSCLTLPFVCSCLSCKAEGPRSEEDVGAVELWNRRCEAAPPPNAPLTLEELREMDGEPVWDNLLKAWGIVVEGSILYRNGEKARICGNGYYRRKPEEG